jgi:hypothetical protein
MRQLLNSILFLIFKINLESKIKMIDNPPQLLDFSTFMYGLLGLISKYFYNLFRLYLFTILHNFYYVFAVDFCIISKNQKKNPEILLFSNYFIFLFFVNLMWNLLVCFGKSSSFDAQIIFNNYASTKFLFIWNIKQLWCFIEFQNIQQFQDSSLKMTRNPRF